MNQTMVKTLLKRIWKHKEQTYPKRNTMVLYRAPIVILIFKNIPANKNDQYMNYLVNFKEGKK